MSVTDNEILWGGEDGFEDTVVTKPPHYTAGSIECIDALASALPPQEFAGFLRANAIKYLWRYDKKGGVEDLKKCRWYVDKLISVLEGGS